MKTIHIIPSKHHQELREYLLESTEFLNNTQILDFNIAFKNDQNAHELRVLTYQKLSNLKLMVLNEVIRFPKTADLIITMAQSLNLYGISIDDLPSEFPLDQDLKHCLEIVMSVLQLPVVNENIQYIAYDHGLSHAEKAFLIEHKISIIELPTLSPQSITYHNALNPRQELEGAIQDILKKKLSDVSFVIPNLKNHLPLIETSFKRYGIELTLEDRSFSVAKTHFLSLFDYAHNPSHANLLKLIETNALNLKNHREVHFYTKKYSQPKEENETLSLILPMLDDLSFIDCVRVPYDILNERHAYSLKPLKTFIESSLRYFDESTVHLLREAINDLSLPSLTHETLSFYDLNDFSIIPQSHVYALMLSAQNYPGVSANSGIFEESYLKRIKGYPLLQERTKHTLITKSSFLRKSQSLTLSYAIANYEGKPQSPSFAIENFVGRNASAWPIAEKTVRLKIRKKLNSSLASQLYSDNGIITTSVSALQLFVNNPYQYFIERGLRLREPEFPNFDPRTLGTINHAIMEKGHLQDDLWEPYTSTFETMIHQRDDVLMKKNLDIVKAGIEISYLEPTHLEYKFENYSLFKLFKLTGIIDRIDTSDHHLMIVDYKSSSQSLSATQFLAGQQLQLLTYGLIASEIFQKKLFAVYNYGFNDTNINTKRFKYTAAKGISPVNDTVIDLYNSSKKYEGWIFDELNDLFTSDAYHKGIKELKSGLKVSPKPYVLETVMFALEEIYQSIYAHIMSGVLDVKDIEIIDQSELNLKEDHHV